MLALVLLGLVSTAVAVPGPLGITEGLPQAQLEQYFDQVAVSVKAAFKDQTSIKDLDWGIDTILGIPFKFKIQTKNGQLLSPTDIKRVFQVTGTQEMSGTAHISGYLFLGKVTVLYDEVGINVFGLQLSGKVQAMIHQCYVPVNIQIYKNVMTDRKVEATVGELQGHLTIHLGTDNYLEKFFDLVLDVLFNLRNFRDIFVWALFDNIIEPLEKAISNGVQ